LSCSFLFTVALSGTAEIENPDLAIVSQELGNASVAVTGSLIRFVCNNFLGSFGRNRFFCGVFGSYVDRDFWYGFNGRGHRLKRLGRGGEQWPSLQFEQAAVGAEVLTVVAGLVTVDEIEGTRVVAEGTEGEASERFRREFGGKGFHVFALHLDFQAGLLDVPGAGAAPAGDCHGVDEVFLDGSAGLEFLIELGGEFVEGVEVFAVENDAFAEPAVLDGVL